MRVIRDSEKNEIMVVEVDESDAPWRTPDRSWFHVVSYDNAANQVYSAAPSDHPAGGTGRWFGRMSDAGVRYVSRGRTRTAALALFRKLCTA